MNLHRRFCLIVTVVAVSLVLVNVTSAQGPVPRSPRTALGTAFTYQGQLKSGGTAYTGNCDFQFSLYGSLGGTDQIGTTQTAPSIVVAGGLFTAPIDFGASAFDGEARWLGIAVRCPAGAGSYTPLDARQPLTAAPYALYATTADSLSGSLGGDVTGTQSSTTVTKLQGRTVASTAPTTGQVLEYDGSQWIPGNYQNVVVVAKSGGNYTSIQTALNNITASDTNRYLIKVMPGTYNEQVTMEPYVDIEGAGEVLTKVTYTGNTSWQTGTVVGADNAELRFLTVENTGGSTYAVAIYNSGSPRFTHLTAKAFGGSTSNYALMMGFSSASPKMTDMTVESTGTSSNNSVEIRNGSPTLTNVTISASGGTENRGVQAGYATPTLTNVTITASGGPGSTNNGVHVYYATVTIQNSAISASGGTTSYGILNDWPTGGGLALVNNSKISGGTNSIKNTNTTRVAASMLDGSVSNTGALSCVFVYNASYAATAC